MFCQYINKDIISNKDIFSHIVSDKQNNYYWSDDWSVDFYIDLAKKGFICTTQDIDNENFVLLAEMQFNYALLNFNELHISKKNIKRLLKQKQATLHVDGIYLQDIIKFIEQTHKYSWVRGRYVKLLEELNMLNRDDFKLLSVVLKKDDTITAGEIGYITNNIYTSLSGFSLRTYNHFGKLQLVMLSKYLQNLGLSFWNLGHPYMQYKLDLGAKIYTREEFLAKIPK